MPLPAASGAPTSSRASSSGSMADSSAASPPASCAASSACAASAPSAPGAGSAARAMDGATASTLSARARRVASCVRAGMFGCFLDFGGLFFARYALVHEHPAVVGLHAECGDLAVGDAHQAIGHVHDLAVVGREHEGGARLAVDVAHQLEDAGAGLAVEVGGG